MKHNFKLYMRILLFSCILLFSNILYLNTYAEETVLKSSIVQKHGDWIYYLDDNQNGCLCKIKPDDTQYTKLYELNASKFFILDDWIYYLTNDNSKNNCKNDNSNDTVYIQEGSFYRIKLDGTCKEKLINDEIHNVNHITSFCYVNNYLIIETEYKFYKMKIDEFIPTHLSKFCKKINTPYGFSKTSYDNKGIIVMITSSKCPYSTFKENGFYRYDLDTDEFIKIFSLDIIPTCFTCKDNWIYYSEGSKIYKLKNDGTEKLTLYDNKQEIYRFEIYNNYLIFNSKRCIQEDRYSGHMFVLNLLTKKKERIPIDFLGFFSRVENIIDNKIYTSSHKYVCFYNLTKKDKIYKPTNYSVFYSSFITSDNSNNIYYLKRNNISKLRPDLTENEFAYNLISNYNQIKKQTSSIIGVYNNDKYIVANDFHCINEDIYVINKADETIEYVIDNNQYHLVDVDNKFIYIKEVTSNNYNLYRIPIGEKDLSKKELIWNTTNMKISGDYFINNDRYTNCEDLKLLNKDTLEETIIKSIKTTMACIHNDSLYYVDKDNGFLYKTSLSKISPILLYKDNRVNQILISNNSIYMDVTKDYYTHVISINLDGTNKEIIDNNITELLNINNKFLIYSTRNKFARYTIGDNKLIYLSDFNKNSSTPNIDTIFSDVENNAWYANSLYKLYEQNIMNGYKGHFSPNKTLTVEQFLKTLCVAINGDIKGVPNEYWAKKYIDFSIKNNYITANQFDNYKKEIKRGEMAVIISNALNLKSLDSDKKSKLIKDIKDFDNIPDNFKDAVLCVYSKGIITGYNDGTFKFENSLTRAQTTAVISRIINKIK